MRGWSIEETLGAFWTGRGGCVGRAVRANLRRTRPQWRNLMLVGNRADLRVAAREPLSVAGSAKVRGADIEERSQQGLNHLLDVWEEEGGAPMRELGSEIEIDPFVNKQNPGAQLISSLPSTGA